MVTEHDYYDDAGEPLTGELESIDYDDDSVLDVTFAYNRLGGHSQVVDDAGTRTFTVNAYGQPDEERINVSGGGLYSKVLARSYGTQSHNKGKLEALVFSTGQTADYFVGYNYNAGYGNLYRVQVIEASRIVQYSLTTNSPLVSAIQVNSTPLRSEITYLSNRDLRDVVQSKRTDTQEVFGLYDYSYDALGRRTGVSNSGTGFAQAAYSDWGYNDRSELISSYRYIPGTPPVEVPAERRLYNYDPIGNRTDHTMRASPTLQLFYCRNAKNQYDTTGADANCPPQAQLESFAYDEDGNLTADGALTYEWDAENRLTSVYDTAPTVNSKKLKFTYDYMGRRVRKLTIGRDAGNTRWLEEPTDTPEADLRFVYDGWNVILVLDGNADVDEDGQPDILRKYTWGLDLSGQSGNHSSPAGIHGAGGIGGLLSVKETQGTTSTADDVNYWFMHDANGNVSQIVKDGTWALVAHYEYDAYGNLVNSPASQDVDNSGYAFVNPFRFSTKWLDGESGLYYYGYRYYSPRLGRWMSRDPIEGEPNLYSHCTNSPSNVVDFHGLYPVAMCCTFSKGTKVWSETNWCDSGTTPEACCKKRAVGWGWLTAWTVLGSRYNECGSDCKWYLRQRLLRDNAASEYKRKVARCCGGHWDLVSSCHGEVWNGWSGPSYNPWSMDPNLSVNDLVFNYVKCKKVGVTYLTLTWNLQWGSAKGKLCQDATHDDIADCVRNKPTVEGKWGVFNNCQTDTREAVRGCCLYCMTD